MKQTNTTSNRRQTYTRNSDGYDQNQSRIPPQAVPLEEAVLGAAMLERDAFSVIIDIVRPESFYVEAHSLIFKAMLELFEKTAPIDLLTMHEKLTTMGQIEAIGGSAYLASLTSRVASAANIEYHARIIAQKYIQRELIRVSSKIIDDSFDDTVDVFDLLDKAEQGLFTITEQNMNKGYEGMNTLAGKALKMIEALLGKPDGLTGITSGFPALDRVTSGWQRTDLIIVAARPAMGKTSFTLALARNAAMNNTADKPFPVAFFSLEMSKIQLVQRLISLEAEISGSSLRGGRLSDDELKRLHLAVEKLSDAPIYIDDSPGLNIFELRAKCRRLKMQHDIQLIIIDYLQLMSGGGDGKNGGNREQEISQISRSLKALAKELNVPVIALSQLSRAVESRGGNKRPQLSDLRESGAIEQDADIVSFIYRPEYYQITEDDDGNSTKNVGEIIIAKHRNGALENVRLKFLGEYAKFMNWDDELVNNVSFDEVFTSNPSAQSNLITRPSRLNQGSQANDDLLAPSPMTPDEEVPF